MHTYSAKIISWVAGLVNCSEWGSDYLHVVQLMPLPLHYLFLHWSLQWFIFLVLSVIVAANTVLYCLLSARGWGLVLTVNCSIVFVSVLAPVLVPMNVGDIPSHLPAIDDYVSTVPGNTNFPGLLDSSSSTAGLFLLHINCEYVMSSTL